MLSTLAFERFACVCLCTNLENLVGTLAERRVHRRVDRNLACELRVELGDIVVAAQHWLDGRLQAARQHVLPVGVLEEHVILDGLGVLGAAAQTLRHLPLHQALEQIARVRRQIGGQVDLAAQNRFDGLFAVLGGERRQTGQHVVHEGAQRPPVDRFAVAAAHQDLGRPVQQHKPVKSVKLPMEQATHTQHLHILDGAAERVRDDAIVDVLLAQTEVGQLDVTLCVQQNVLGLEIAIDDAQRVQMFQRADDLGQVETGPRQTEEKR